MRGDAIVYAYGGKNFLEKPADRFFMTAGSQSTCPEREPMARTSKQIEDNIVNSIIGEGSEFKGEFTVNGLLRIDGRFKGTIETDGKVLIGQSGEATTDIRARVVVIGGVVRGNIFATERVIMLATGRLYGNIITPSLVMEDGVIFDGNCVINKSPDHATGPQTGTSEHYGETV
jgi:cytoskeletal protein CcmA (bactofilin family)